MRIALLTVAVVGLVGCGGQTSSSGEAAGALKQVPRTENPYTLFESLQVRPLALSPSGKLLFACNTPDNRLEILHINDSGALEAVTSVPVGLEPVAVAARNSDEVWVVNHLSDSVSIVDVSNPFNARVVRTLWVGDEPRDIVFAGPNRARAFITAAHRGQNSPDDPELFKGGVGRADVWVFDAANLGDPAGGTRLAKLTFFADTPRALAASADGSRVYAAAFASGNQTTIVSVDAVKHKYPNGMPGPAVLPIPTPNGTVYFPQPQTGLIVKYKPAADGTFHWYDAYGTTFDEWVRVRLPDKDVFAIDANATPPSAIGSGVYAHVGTTLFNMTVNPVNGKVYVTNTDARNDVRFEGHGSATTTTVRSHIVDNQISVINPATGAVQKTNLNPHIDYSVDSTPGEKEKSVAFPQDIVVSKDGATAYVVAQGSAKLAFYKTSDLENGTVNPSLADQALLSAGGPTGVVVAGGRAYVLTRFDNGISTVDTATRKEVAHVKLFNPETPIVTRGRQYLYDATFTSGHGDQACASCHVGGDNDQLGWDLGNPGGGPLPVPQGQFTISRQIIEALIPETAYIFNYFQPVKGPMTTQSLRGMDNHGAMHWRGDRNGAFQQNGQPFPDSGGNSAQPDTGIYNEFHAFMSFNVAFPGLVGRDSMLSDEDMTDYTNFVLQISYPPNPIRNLDSSLTASQAAGRAFYFNTLPDGREAPSDRFHNCAGCHKLDPNGNAGATKHPGFFGTEGKLSFENEPQTFKVPHLRNMYTKVGMFGSAPDQNMLITVTAFNGPATVQDQVRGYGYQHDGALGTLEHFFTGLVFIQTYVDVILPNGSNAGPNPFGVPFLDPNNPFAGAPSPEGFTLRHNIVDFMLAFDSNQAPIVGQQVTLTAGDRATANPRIDLMIARCTAAGDHPAECDLVVTGRSKGVPISFVWTGSAFQPNTMRLLPVADSVVRSLVGTVTDSLTYTAVPLGSGWRIGIDRDGDGWADTDEILAGTSPTDPNSHP
jgi:DNA-binding beta-propeller fold protein YncE